MAATLGLGRTTVLKILKTAEVEVRPGDASTKSQNMWSRTGPMSQNMWSRTGPIEDAVETFRLTQDKSKGVFRVVVGP